MPTCIICGSTVHSGLVRSKKAKWFACTECGHSRITMSQKHATGFHETTTTWKFNDFSIRDEYIRIRRKLVLDAIGCEPASVLDIGCGDCAFLGSWKNSRCVGVDPNLGVSPPFEVPLHKVGLESFCSDEKFDLVASIHSLEHVSNCVKMFEKMVGMTAKCLIVEVPVLRKLRKFNGHIHNFSKKSLLTLADRFNDRITTHSVVDNIQGNSCCWVGVKK